MTNKSQNWLALSIALTLSAAAWPAHAQNTIPDDGMSEGTLEEVVVTAQRRDESLQEVPISITALSSGEILDRGFIRVSEIAQAVPNMQYTDLGGAQVFIRGVGQSDLLPTADPGVAIYTDGVYNSRQTGVPTNLADIESIEVLRGPQGTLFGRNSLGGAIIINTFEPNGEFGGFARAQGGSRDLWQFDGRVSFPITSTLSGYVSAGFIKQDGYVKNLATGQDFNDTDRKNARAKFRWEATDSFTLSFSGDYEEHDENGVIPTNTQILPGTTPAFFAGAFPLLSLAPQLTSTQYTGLYNFSVGCTPENATTSPDCFGPQYEQAPYTTQETESNPMKGHNWGLSMIAAWELETVDIKSITAYREFEATLEQGIDGSPLPIAAIGQDDHQDQFSQEVQISGTSFNDRLKWTGGVYYFNEKVENNSVVQFIRTVPPVFPLAGLDDGTGNPIFSPDGPIIAPTQVFFTALNLNTFRNQRTISTAIYGQGTYDISDALSFTLGVRWSKDKKDFSFDQTDLTQPPAIPGVMDASSPDLSDSWNSFTPRLGFEYQINDSSMLYVSYAQGYKSGGFNARPTTNPPRFTTYEPETLDTIEFGFKTEWLDNTLRFNGDFFYSKYKDIQLPTFLFLEGDYITEVANSGDGTSKGAEFELTWVAHPRFYISAGIGMLRFKYTDVNEVAGPGTDTPPGDMLPSAPEFTGNLSATATLFESAAGVLQLRGDYYYQSKVAFDVFNTHIQPGYGLLNGRLSFENADQTWNVFVAGYNLTDKLYANAITDFNLFSIAEQVFYAAPRTIVAGVEFAF